MTEWLLDGLLVFTLLMTASATLVSRDLFRAVVLFIAFGLVMAACWVRLDAPNIALAEAAIGAGLSGVLFLDAVSQLRRGQTRKRSASADQSPEAGT
ncbi:Na(+)/H(+) antiporter subunit B [Marinobacter salicampi]|uniref:Na(+)/H(+) antiporter subunit B n=1 Tax=Marinobacter salicampi TaxID=435907 RepID=UPI00140AA9E8|nr:hydrogenase subunit MbhD domain-containing protein [Marinobacter salicampi]